MTQVTWVPNMGELHPLKRISPSRFASLKECTLREVWIANRKELLLPASPTAKLGSVIHKLLELAGKESHCIQGIADIEMLWDKLIQQTEQQMQNSRLERPLLPLRKLVPDYEVRKIRAFRKAGEIAQATSKQLHNTDASQNDFIGSTKSQFELWVESKDSLIGGSIDEVVRTDEGYILRDYKSGYIMQKDEVTGDLEVKESYQLQLKLYAAMFAQSYGQFPIRLELVPLQGEDISISFQTAECEELLAQAALVLQELNSKITAVTSLEQHEGEKVLANPEPVVCRSCRFRPGCSAYHSFRQSSDSTDWAKDVWGELVTIQRLGNGKLNLNLRVNNQSYLNANIRGLNPSEERHPILQLVQPGDRIGIYNLQGNLQTGAFSETPSTVIYRVEYE